MGSLENEIQLNNITNEAIIDKDVFLSGISWHVLRLDLVHPVISGNKYFKLKYYLREAIAGRYKGILTFGGAYSNHIIAAAYVASVSGLSSIGIIRGERPAIFSQSLLNAEAYAMKFKFISREEYATKEDGDWQEKIKADHPGFYVIPEGGYGNSGAKGAGEILELFSSNQYTHICCACGTGTMLAGLINASRPEQICIGISALKGHGQLNKLVTKLLYPMAIKKRFDILHDFHFGGYAKPSKALFNYMNHFYQKHGISTDFIYTAKLMYAVEHLIKDHFFPGGSRILSIHSGGLQGNQSLLPGILVF